MIKLSKFLSLLLLLIFLTTFNPRFSSSNKSFVFPIKEIIIENTLALDQKLIMNELHYLHGRNLFFLNLREVKNSIIKFDFVSSFKIRKIYPNSIKIHIYEKTPVAIYIVKKNKFYLTEDGSLIKYLKIEKFNELPLVFGKNIKFKEFFSNMKSISFPLELIESLHYFEIGRWDIKLKNKKVIKLPVNNYIKKVKNFITINKNKSFDKYSIFDYRINDQLILK
jgi:cell division protein FtsQ